MLVHHVFMKFNSKNRLNSLLFKRNTFLINKNQRNYVSFSLDDDDDDDRIYINPKKDNLPRATFIRGKYITPWTQNTNKKWTSVMKWLLSSLFSNDDKEFQKRYYDTLEFKNRQETQQFIQEQFRTSLKNNNNNDNKNTVTWIGHSTCLLEIDGIRILTDPIFSEYAFPIQAFVAKRYVPPGLLWKDIQQQNDNNNMSTSNNKNTNIDIVLLSHNHYDHLDALSVLEIGNSAFWYVPLGLSKTLESMGINRTNIQELDWWQTHKFVKEENNNNDNDNDNKISPSSIKSIEVTLCPAKHWAGRNLWDRGKTLHGSFALKTNSNTSAYFGGDTGYCEVFEIIGRLLGPFDLAILPIGAYKPRWFMKNVHCDPEEVVQMHKDLKAKQTLGVHWGTFSLSDEDDMEPALELGRVREIANLDSNHIFTMKPGETLEIRGNDNNNNNNNFHAAENNDIDNNNNSNLDNNLTGPKGDFAACNPILFEKYKSLYKQNSQKQKQ